MLWLALVEAPFAIFGLWTLRQIASLLMEDARKHLRHEECARKHGGHALKATRWYRCRACDYEATFAETRAEVEKEERAGGTRFVILKPMGE